MESNHPVLAAIKAGDRAAVQEALAQDNALLAARTSRGDSLVRYALDVGRRDMADLLVQHGAELGLVDAAAMGALDRVQAAVAADPAALGRMDEQGWHLLHIAAYYGATNVVGWLLGQGVAVDVRSQGAVHNNTTPLLAAVAGSRADITELLLDRGADPNLRDGDEVTTLHVAIQNGKINLVRVLLMNGADATMELKGEDCVSLAERLGHHDIAELIRWETGM